MQSFFIRLESALFLSMMLTESNFDSIQTGESDQENAINQVLRKNFQISSNMFIALANGLGFTVAKLQLPVLEGFL